MTDQLTKIEKHSVKVFELLLSKQTNELQTCLNAFSAAACQLVDYLVSGNTGITTFSATICKKAVKILRIVTS